MAGIKGGSIYYTTEAYEPSLKELLKTIENIRKKAEDALNIDGGGRATQSIKEITTSVKALGAEYAVLTTDAKALATALKGVGQGAGGKTLSDAQKEARAYGSEVKALVAEQKAGLATQDQVVTRLRTITTELNKSMGSVDKSTKEYAEYSSALNSASTQLGKFEAAQQKQKAVFNADSVRRYRDAVSNLRQEYEAGMISTKRFIDDTAHLQREMEELRGSFSRSSKEYAGLTRGIGMAQRGITTANGAVSKLGLSQQVAIGNTKALTFAIAGLGKSGQSGAMGITAMGTASTRSAIGMKAFTAASTATNAAAKGLVVSFRSLMTAMLPFAGIYGAMQLGKGLQGFVKEADAARVATLLLNQQLAKSGQDTDKANEAFDRVATTLKVSRSQVDDAALQLTRYGFAAEDAAKLLIAGGASALAFGKDAAAGIDNVAAAVVTENSALLNQIGIAENIGKGMSEAGKAAEGAGEAAVKQAKAQAALNIILDATGTEVESLNTLLDSYAGTTADVNQKIYGLRLAIGDYLTPAITGAKTAFVEVFDVLMRQNAFKATQEDAYSLGRSVIDLVGFVGESTIQLSVMFKQVAGLFVAIDASINSLKARIGLFNDWWHAQVMLAKTAFNPGQNQFWVKEVNRLNSEMSEGIKATGQTFTQTFDAIAGDAQAMADQAIVSLNTRLEQTKQNLEANAAAAGGMGEAVQQISAQINSMTALSAEQREMFIKLAIDPKSQDDLRRGVEAAIANLQADLKRTDLTAAQRQGIERALPQYQALIDAIDGVGQAAEGATGGTGNLNDNLKDIPMPEVTAEFTNFSALLAGIKQDIKASTAGFAEGAEGTKKWTTAVVGEAEMAQRAVAALRKELEAPMSTDPIESGAIWGEMYGRGKAARNIMPDVKAQVAPYVNIFRTLKDEGTKAFDAVSEGAGSFIKSIAGTITQTGEFNSELNNINAEARLFGESIDTMGARADAYKNRMLELSLAGKENTIQYRAAAEGYAYWSEQAAEATRKADEQAEAQKRAKEADESRATSLIALGNALGQAHDEYIATGDKMAYLEAKSEALKTVLAELEKYPVKNATEIAKYRAELEATEKEQTDFVQSLKYLGIALESAGQGLSKIGENFDVEGVQEDIDALTESRNKLLEGGKYDPKALDKLNSQIAELENRKDTFATITGLIDGMVTGFESLASTVEDGLSIEDQALAGAEALGVLGDALREVDEDAAGFVDTLSAGLAGFAAGGPIGAVAGAAGGFFGWLFGSAQQTNDDAQAYLDAVDKYGEEAVEKFRHWTIAGWDIDREGLNNYVENREAEAAAAEDARKREVEATREAKEEILDMERKAAQDVRDIRTDATDSRLEYYEQKNTGKNGKVNKGAQKEIAISETVLDLREANREYQDELRRIGDERAAYIKNYILSHPELDPATARAMAEAEADKIFGPQVDAVKEGMAYEVGTIIEEGNRAAKELGISQEEYWKAVFEGNEDVLGPMAEGQRQGMIEMVELMKAQGLEIPPVLEKYYNEYVQGNQYGATMAADSTEEAHKKLAGSFNSILDLVLQNFGPEAQAAVRKALEPFYNTAQAEIDKGSQEVAWAATGSTGGFEAAAGQILKLIEQRFGPEAAAAVRKTLLGFYDGTADAIESGSGEVGSTVQDGTADLTQDFSDSGKHLVNTIGAFFGDPVKELNVRPVQDGLASAFETWGSTVKSGSNSLNNDLKTQTALLVKAFMTFSSSPATALSGQLNSAKNAISSFIGGQTSWVNTQARNASQSILNSASLIRKSMNALVNASTLSTRKGSSGSSGRTTRGGGGSGFAGFLSLADMNPSFMRGEFDMFGEGLDGNWREIIGETERNPYFYGTSARAFAGSTYYGGGGAGATQGTRSIGKWLAGIGMDALVGGKKAGKQLGQAGKEVKKGGRKLGEDLDEASREVRKGASKLSDASKEMAKRERQAADGAKQRSEDRKQRLADAKEEARANAEAAREALKVFNADTFSFLNSRSLLQMRDGGKTYGRLASTFGNVALSKGLSDAQTKLMEFVKGVGTGLEQGVAGGIASGIKTAMQSGELLSVQSTMQSLFDTTFQGLFDRISNNLISGAFGTDIARLTEAITEGNVQKSAQIMDKIGTTLPRVMQQLNDRLAPLKSTFDKFLKTDEGTSYENLGQTIKLEARSLGSATPDWTLMFKGSADLMKSAALKQMEAANMQIQAANRAYAAAELLAGKAGLEARQPKRLRALA